jgi:hypothetical protein
MSNTIFSFGLAQPGFGFAAECSGQRYFVVDSAERHFRWPVSHHDPPECLLDQLYILVE